MIWPPGNVASVALARAGQRVYEVALTLSFGTPRHRLFRQLLVSLSSGVIFGLVPAIRLARADLVSGLRPSEVRGGTARSRWLRSALVAGEVALSMALVTGAGVMLKSLWVLNRQPAGFTADRRLTLRSLPSSARYGSARRDSRCR